ncbi:MAG: hypothetical protein ABEK59_06765 [Halobacteria archaeon]
MSDKIRTRDLRKLERRSFMKKLSAVGVSGPMLKYMSKEKFEDAVDKDEVPYVAYRKVVEKEPRKPEGVVDAFVFKMTTQKYLSEVREFIFFGS